jgi:hypothetical protein
MAADGAGVPTRLTTSRAFQAPYSWANGGDTLLIEQRSADQTGGGDIFLLSLTANAAASPLVHTPADETEPVVSPDGRWVAYTAKEAGGSDVFVRPFPRVDDGRWRISTDSGDSPLWSRDGKRLFFISRGLAMSVPIETVPAFRAGTPAVMFSLPPFYSSSLRTRRQWDMAPAGERFVIVRPGDVAASEQSRMIVVLNWYEELKRLVPSR